MENHRLETKLRNLPEKICLNTAIILAGECFRDFIKAENNLFENDIIEAWGYDSLEDTDPLPLYLYYALVSEYSKTPKANKKWKVRQNK